MRRLSARREALCQPFGALDHTSVGLGLAVCKAIVEAHGRKIAICDEPSGGANVRFSLPVHSDALGGPTALDNNSGDDQTGFGHSASVEDCPLCLETEPCRPLQIAEASHGISGCTGHFVPGLESGQRARRVEPVCDLRGSGR